MGKYFESLNPEIKAYFRILSGDFPEWLEAYINTKEMQRIGQISMSCGTDYSKLFNVRYFYSNLDHSVGVALIIWNFTHDKKQTLAGLFHDIATPVFKHCIDFMNGDSEHQESTEAHTIDIIKSSKEITTLLARDNLKLEEVIDYKLYPLADNDMPRLAADRFEYIFSSGLTFFQVFDLDTIAEVYANITIIKNEQKLEELAFKDKEVCEKYIRIISKLWPEWVNDKSRTLMQFYVNMCKSMHKIGKLNLDDLYTLSEAEVIETFSKYDPYLADIWLKFSNCEQVYKSETLVPNKYCVNVKSKIRYINPLVAGYDGKRITEISAEAKELIDAYLEMPKGGYYTYFDFDFKPYDS